jgi:prepilin-type N-terminal cleavage/methylation domain-containing protein
MFPLAPASRSFRKRGAFTLIELLVVISIIAILVAILIPVLALTRSRMDSAQCLSQLRQIGAGINAYTNDNSGLLPGPLNFAQSATYTPNQAGSLPAMLESYLGTAGIPSASGGSRYSPLFECPAAARLLHDHTTPTYIMNFLAFPEISQPIWGDTTQPGETPQRLASISNWGTATTGSGALTMSQTWALQDADQGYISQVTFATGPTGNLLPSQAHGDHWNDLFFDFHTASRYSLISVNEPAKSTPPPGSGTSGP